MRILGLDPGEKRIGVAVSDSLGITAQGIGVIAFSSAEEALLEIERYCTEYEVKQIVVGLPLDMKGHHGEAARKAEEFAATLRFRLNLPVELFDERLSSQSAEKTLISGGMRRKKRKTVKDMLAAVLILETYLQMQERKRGEE